MDTCNSSIASDGRYLPNGNSLKLKQLRPPIGWSFFALGPAFSNQKSLALGPVLGGLLVQALGWRSIFIVNVPVGLLALWLTQRHIPKGTRDRSRSLDPLGQLLPVGILAAAACSLIGLG